MWRDNSVSLTLIVYNLGALIIVLVYVLSRNRSVCIRNGRMQHPASSDSRWLSVSESLDQGDVRFFSRVESHLLTSRVVVQPPSVFCVNDITCSRKLPPPCSAMFSAWSCCSCRCRVVGAKRVASASSTVLSCSSVALRLWPTTSGRINIFEPINSRYQFASLSIWLLELKNQFQLFPSLRNGLV